MRAKNNAHTPPSDQAEPFFLNIWLDVRPFARAKLTALLVFLGSKLYHYVLGMLSPALGLDDDWENKALSSIDSLVLIVWFCLISCVLVLEVVKRIKSIERG